jgi:hypothetical protein
MTTRIGKLEVSYGARGTPTYRVELWLPYSYPRKSPSAPRPPSFESDAMSGLPVLVVPASHS